MDINKLRHVSQFVELLLLMATPIRQARAHNSSRRHPVGLSDVPRFHSNDDDDDDDDDDVVLDLWITLFPRAFKEQ